MNNIQKANNYEQNLIQGWHRINYNNEANDVDWTASGADLHDCFYAYCGSCSYSV